MPKDYKHVRSTDNDFELYSPESPTYIRSQGRRSTLRNVLIYSLPAALLSFLTIAIVQLSSSKSIPLPYSMESSALSQYFDPAMNRHLTAEQCEATFPGLNKEAERAKEFWLKRGGIKEQDVQRAQDGVENIGVRVLIADNRMYIRWREFLHTYRLNSAHFTD